LGYTGGWKICEVTDMWERVRMMCMWKATKEFGIRETAKSWGTCMSSLDGFEPLFNIPKRNMMFHSSRQVWYHVHQKCLALQVEMNILRRNRCTLLISPTKFLLEIEYR
jgi:hypothetical protein